MLTPRQQAIYRPLVQRAWLAHCARTGQNPEADAPHESWYRAQLMDAMGIYSTKEASPTRDFDRLLGHFGGIAGETDLVLRSAEGDERRLRYLIAREIQRGAVPEAYVLGIARNMGYPAKALSELPADHLWRIWNALLRHNRRHAAPPARRPARGAIRSANRYPRVSAPLPF